MRVESKILILPRSDLYALIDCQINYKFFRYFSHFWSCITMWILSKMIHGQRELFFLVPGKVV